MTPKREMIVEFFPPWKENILRSLAWCLGIRGVPVGFIHYETKFDDDSQECRCEYETHCFCNEPTINDIKRNEEESQMNRKEDNGDDILKP